MMRIYNSLSRQIEAFEPMEPGKVGMYACGPTVYDYVSVGNWRTNTLADLLVRTFGYFGYETEYVMNITDVGHLTGDNLGDADTGEDRMEKAAARERRTAWKVAEFYTQDFLRGFDQLNLVAPKKFAKATDHIKEQIELVQKIEAAGFTYRIGDGIYFDTQAYEKAGNKYGELSTLDEIKEGIRVAKNLEKRGPRDFAVWKFNLSGSKREMEWDSPWGKGFPGWHIECSAMGMKYLGEQFDVHVGGEDLKSTHHANEVAQSEAATGKKPFVKYWVHGAFLTVDGGRMGKSLGNAYSLQILQQRKIPPMALRYFYLTGHYRKQLNFTWAAVTAAKTAYEHLTAIAGRCRATGGVEETSLSKDGLEYQEAFGAALADDLNLPQALRVLWEMVGSGLDSGQQYALLVDMDRVLGLGLDKAKDMTIPVQALPLRIQELVKERQARREAGDFEAADGLRREIESEGYLIEDAASGLVVRKKG